VDGSNLGISITPDHKLLFQNRSHYVNTETQAQVRDKLVLVHARR
jgi:hypothetical protein